MSRMSADNKRMERDKAKNTNCCHGCARQLVGCNDCVALLEGNVIFLKPSRYFTLINFIPSFLFTLHFKVCN